MRILFVCQHYWPEPFNSTDVCETLVSHGHEVTVLTGLPNTGMPGNDTLPEYRGGKRLEETHNGVRILRVKMHPRKYGAVHRVANYLTFWHNANKAAKKLDETFDVVLGYQFSPIMQVDPGVKYAEKTGTPIMILSFDLWPESLVAGGIKRGTPPFRWIEGVSKRIYASADTLAITSPRFRDYFEDELGLKGIETVYIPQYAEDLFANTDAPAPQGYDESKVTFTFAGNVGAAQGIETLVRAASLLSSDDRVAFHVVGSGSRFEECKSLAGQLGVGNLTFHGRHELEEMPSFYAASDCMLATFSNDPLLDWTLPRKVQTYMAASKPIICTSMGEAKRVVEEAACGYCCPPDDPQALADLCARLADLEPAQRQAMGKSGGEYYAEHFAKDQFFEALERELGKLVGTRHGDKL